MIKTLGVVMGLLFLLGGIIGFVPGVIQNGLYLGIFRVNTAHGIVHIFSGAVFLFASMAGPRAIRGWFQIFGVVYAAVAAMGFEVGEGLICGVISNNQYDAWGHAVLALGMLLVGFFPRRATAAASCQRLRAEIARKVR